MFLSDYVDNNAVFLHCLVEGVISVYALEMAIRSKYYVKKENEELTLLPFDEKYKIVDGKTYFYKTKSHSAILKYLMKDTPSLQSRIEQMEEPDYNKLIDLARDYHNIVCTDEECKVYESPKAEVIKLLEPVVGIASYREVDEVLKATSFNLGCLLHISASRTNDRIFYKTGLMLTNIKYDNGEDEITLKIPLYLEYVGPDAKVRPRFGGGINIYQPMHHSAGFMAALDYNLGNDTYITIGTNLDFISKALVIPEKLLTLNFNIGVVLPL